MQRIKLDLAPAAVKEFFGSLSFESDGVELELEGQILCKVVSPHWVTDEEREKRIEAARKIIRQAQARNRGVPQREIAQVVDEAVEESVADIGDNHPRRTAFDRS